MASWFSHRLEALQSKSALSAISSQGAPLFRARLKLLGLVLLGAASVVLGSGCAAIYPEISTPLKTVPPGERLEPPPPADMLFIAFKSAQIPKLTRDGRRWDELGAGAPDSFAVVRLGKEELMRTDVETDSYSPTWAHSAKENYEVPRGESLTIELWEQNNVVDHPICSKHIREPHDEAINGELRINCESGASIFLQLEPAKAQFGLGLYYELRAESVAVTRTLPRSPAARQNLKRGDVILRVMGQAVRAMNEAEFRTAINANSPTGVSLTVRSPGGKERTIVLTDGPIYSLAARKL